MEIVKLTCPGHSTLPTTCPVCEHSPVSAEDCTPHKSLRTTIRVFLRTEEKKREAIKAKEQPSKLPEISEPATETVDDSSLPAVEQQEKPVSTADDSSLAVPTEEEPIGKGDSAQSKSEALPEVSDTPLEVSYFLFASILTYTIVTYTIVVINGSGRSR
jgi:hypothetical protein